MDFSFLDKDSVPFNVSTCTPHSFLFIDAIPAICEFLSLHFFSFEENNFKMNLSGPIHNSTRLALRYFQTVLPPLGNCKKIVSDSARITIVMD